jgi:hypothetical protein
VPGSGGLDIRPPLHIGPVNMRQRVRFVALAIISAVAVARTSAAQRAGADGAPLGRDRGSLGRILGVIDGRTNLPIDSADVTDLVTDATYRTGRAGLIGLAGFHSQHDTIAVRVRKIGYRDTAFVVQASDPDSIPITLVLDRVQTLPAILSTAVVHERLIGPLQEFAERLNDKSLHGAFFTPEILRKNEGLRIDDLLYPAIIAQCGSSRFIPKYYVNGLPTARMDELPRGLEAYDAIEVYGGGSTPMRYGGHGCVVLLWTRQKV